MADHFQTKAAVILKVPHGLRARAVVTSSPRGRCCRRGLGDAIQSIIGGETISLIKLATTYTLTCLDLTGVTQTKSATVSILPTFQEQ